VLRICGSREHDQSVSDGDWIRQESFVGRFEREIGLPQGVDPASIDAAAGNGVVEVRIPSTTCVGTAPSSDPVRGQGEHDRGHGQGQRPTRKLVSTGKSTGWRNPTGWRNGDVFP